MALRRTSRNGGSRIRSTTHSLEGWQLERGSVVGPHDDSNLAAPSFSRPIDRPGGLGWWHCMYCMYLRYAPRRRASTVFTNQWGNLGKNRPSVAGARHCPSAAAVPAGLGSARLGGKLMLRGSSGTRNTGCHKSRPAGSELRRPHSAHCHTVVMWKDALRALLHVQDLLEKQQQQQRTNLALRP